MPVAVPGNDPEEEPSDETLTQAQMELEEILSELVGRSRRQAADLAAILDRLDQLKAEIRLHQARLARGRTERAATQPGTATVCPPTDSQAALGADGATPSAAPAYE